MINRILKKQQNNNNSKYYDLYKHEYINCAFCNKLVTLYNAKNHLNNNCCLEFQKILIKEELKKRLCDYYKKINELKSKIKYNIIEDIEDNEDNENNEE